MIKECPRCHGTGKIGREIVKPKWCNNKDLLKNHKDCCICKKEAYYQIGDGKIIHSLCKLHYDKIKLSLGDNP